MEEFSVPGQNLLFLIYLLTYLIKSESEKENYRMVARESFGKKRGLHTLNIMQEEQATESSCEPAGSDNIEKTISFCVLLQFIILILDYVFYCYHLLHVRK